MSVAEATTAINVFELPEMEPVTIHEKEVDWSYLFRQNAYVVAHQAVDQVRHHGVVEVQELAPTRLNSASLNRRAKWINHQLVFGDYLLGNYRIEYDPHKYRVEIRSHRNKPSESEPEPPSYTVVDVIKQEELHHALKIN